MKRLAAILIAIAGTTLSPAHAQNLRPVEPDFGDTDPLRTNLRRLQDPLVAPNGFDRVFADDERGVFMRISGAVRAVFPRSSYVPTPYGNLPIFPAGTVFEIGRIPEQPAEPHPLAGHATAAPINGRVDGARIGAVRLPRAIHEPTGPSIWTDETLRQARITGLIDRAAKTRRND